MYKQSSINRLYKRADGFWRTILPTTTDAINIGSDVATMYAAYLLAGSMLVGGLAGWGASKLVSPGDREMDTARLSYENERLASDIGYLKSRISQERGDNARKSGPKAMRMF